MTAPGKYRRTAFSKACSPFLFIAHSLLDFAFPPLCLLCNDPVDRPGSRWLCAKCRDRFRASHASRNACSRCSQNLDYRSCPCEHVWTHPFDRIHSFLDYDDDCQRIMKEIKYRGKKSLAIEMGALFSDSIPQDYLSPGILTTVIPLHKNRKLKRGYNQAEQLARGFLKNHPTLAFHPNLMYRRRATGTQTKLTREQRKENLARAFGLHERYKDLVHGKTVLLIDDVVTTGATTGVCADVLRGAGAQKVFVLSLVRAD